MSDSIARSFNLTNFEGEYEEDGGTIASKGRDEKRGPDVLSLGQSFLFFDRSRPRTRFLPLASGRRHSAHPYIAYISQWQESRFPFLGPRIKRDALPTQEWRKLRSWSGVGKVSRLTSSIARSEVSRFPCRQYLLQSYFVMFG